MKGKFLKGLAFMFMMITTAHAHTMSSDLKIRFAKQGNYQVYIDGHRFNATNQINIGRLTAGNHQLKIYRKTYNPYGCNHQGSRKLVYCGDVFVPRESKVYYTHHVNHLDRDRVIRKTHQHNSYGNNNGCGYNNWDNGFDNGHHDDHFEEDGHHDHDDFDFENSDVDFGDYDGHNHGNTGWNNGNGTHNMGVISPNQFSHLISAVKQTPFDKDRFQLAETALMGSRLTTQQAKQLARQFDFDSNRLKFAKMAYHKVIDRDRYFTMASEFDFQSNKRKLLDYIQQN